MIHPRIGSPVSSCLELSQESAVACDLTYFTKRFRKDGSERLSIFLILKNQVYSRSGQAEKSFVPNLYENRLILERRAGIILWVDQVQLCREAPAGWVPEAQR